MIRNGIRRGSNGKDHSIIKSFSSNSTVTSTTNTNMLNKIMKKRIVHSMSPSILRSKLSRTSTMMILMISMLFLSTISSAALDSNCVITEDQLKSAVNNANNSLSKQTIVDVCTSYINMTSQINVFNKSIQLRCVLPNITQKCTLDVQKKSRHFLIQNSILLFKQLIFVNGSVSGSDGGSLKINGSSVEILDSNFLTNQVPCILNTLPLKWQMS